MICFLLLLVESPRTFQLSDVYDSKTACLSLTAVRIHKSGECRPSRIRWISFALTCPLVQVNTAKMAQSQAVGSAEGFHGLIANYVLPQRFIQIDCMVFADTKAWFIF